MRPSRHLKGHLTVFLANWIATLYCLTHGELDWLFLEPDRGLDRCPRILLLCFRSMNSAPIAAQGWIFSSFYSFLSEQNDCKLIMHQLIKNAKWVSECFYHIHDMRRLTLFACIHACKETWGKKLAIRRIIFQSVSRPDENRAGAASFTSNERFCDRPGA